METHWRVLPLTMHPAVTINCIIQPGNETKWRFYDSKMSLQSSSLRTLFVPIIVYTVSTNCQQANLKVRAVLVHRRNKAQRNIIRLYGFVVIKRTCVGLSCTVILCSTCYHGIVFIRTVHTVPYSYSKICLRLYTHMTHIVSKQTTQRLQTILLWCTLCKCVCNTYSHSY